MEKKKDRANFSGKIGYILATAGASVGLGNIWRFPYLAAKYGGGIFILVYIILSLTFGYTMIISETAIGRISRRSPAGAFPYFSKSAGSRIGGWLNALVPILVVSYYCVIGGWVLRYFVEYLIGHDVQAAESGNFSAFISTAGKPELYFIIFAAMTTLVVALGVNAGVERISKIMMPLLLLLAVGISCFTISQPGASQGVKYALIPDFSGFSIKTIIAAMEQMFYSLSIAMGILVTFGSYMKKEVDVERSTLQVILVDSGVAILAVLMIIPGIFAFSGESAAETLQAGPSLLFISLPEVFVNMPGGRLVGTLFFLMVLFAALTSAIALMESAVSTIEDELRLSRKKSSMVIAAIILILGSLASLGYNVLAETEVFSMQFLDFFDFLANALLMPIGAFATCLLIDRSVKLSRVTEEITHSSAFRGRKIYEITVRYVAPVFLVVILVCSVLTTLGILHM
ncbi:MAG: sodium-dependent transporter [Lachnospiraceae bacterium]|nr:sodium-dependent transporter [Lachnospiraceae bacterium]